MPGEMEAQRRKVPCSQPHSQDAASMGVDLLILKPIINLEGSRLLNVLVWK